MYVDGVTFLKVLDVPRREMYVHFSSFSVDGDLAGFMINLGNGTRHLMGAHHAACHAHTGVAGATTRRAGAHGAGIAASISRGFPRRHITAFVGCALGFSDTDISITRALCFGISGAAGRSSSLNPHFGFTLRLRRAGIRHRTRAFFRRRGLVLYGPLLGRTFGFDLGIRGHHVDGAAGKYCRNQ